MSNRFLIVIIGLLIIFGGIFAFTKHKTNSQTTNTTTAPTENIEGQGKAGVTLIEYGDFQCPACGEYYPIVKQLFSTYQTQIYFQFRNFPLTQIHQNAFAGARAAEAAALQGKFWQMHDLLYDENDTYYNDEATGKVYNTWIDATNPNSYFDEYAAELGLNQTKFEQDLESSTVNNLVNADMSAGNALGIDATPTFFIDGKQIQNPTSIAGFDTLINNAIASKKKA